MTENWKFVHENAFISSILSHVDPLGQIFSFFFFHFDCLTLAVDSGEHEKLAAD